MNKRGHPSKQEKKRQYCRQAQSYSGSSALLWCTMVPGQNNTRWAKGVTLRARSTFTESHAVLSRTECRSSLTSEESHRSDHSPRQAENGKTRSRRSHRPMPGMESAPQAVPRPLRTRLDASCAWRAKYQQITFTAPSTRTALSLPTPAAAGPCCRCLHGRRHHRWRYRLPTPARPTTQPPLAGGHPRCRRRRRLCREGASRLQKQRS